MRVRTILVCFVFVVGLMMASCSASSKTCPAYSNADDAETLEVNS